MAGVSIPKDDDSLNEDLGDAVLGTVNLDLEALGQDDEDEAVYGSDYEE